MTFVISPKSAPDLPPELQRLVQLCKRDMGASEVWLFGSRARGDFREDSDYDVLAVIPDDAPVDVDTLVAAFRLRRRSRAHADLLTARMSEFQAAKTTPNTISFAAAQEGIRIDA
ncbi:nucleotidyltransferase domain-containing protein [Yoonia sp.]|uniref:nucleotidyltransferase domain-containing protein n=1 Tax=Yoonia sp. TaxID=2212373 RepID=UPI00391B2847